MPVTVRSFAKINLGLWIGPLRDDGFHELRTVYQTIGLHDVVRVSVRQGSGIEIRCSHPRVPTDSTNTCYRIVEKVLRALNLSAQVAIEIEKRLPVQGGLGGASSNAIATMLALERALKKSLPGPERLRIAAEVGSDLPLFLVGGTVLGTAHGEEVYPLADIEVTACVVVAPEVGVSTPKAFADWDLLLARGGADTLVPGQPGPQIQLRDASSKLTPSDPSDRMNWFGRHISAWLSGIPQTGKTGKPASGASARGRGRVESPLLNLVHAGIENDFERVVFPQHPELCELKLELERRGAFYASLSGSGSALYGLFRTRAAAVKAAAALRKKRVAAEATTTVARPAYWRRMFG
jgi:4-diphosphocytidyl-2-C-methyl-D-erythritol kinase